MRVKNLFITSPRRPAVAMVTFLFFSLVPELLANPVKITNQGKAPICISDLVLRTEGGPGQPIVVLRSQTPSDNILLAPNQSTIITNQSPPESGPPIPTWNAVTTVSTGDANNCNGANTQMDIPFTYKPNGILDIVTGTTFSANTALFFGVLQPVDPNFPLSEGRTFSVVNGVNAELGRYFFSTTPFTFSDTGDLIGANGFTGSVTVTGNFRVEAVPEPATLFLLGTGWAGVAIKTRKRLKNRKSG